MKVIKESLFNLEKLKRGIFLTRPNRFIGEIKYKKKVEKAHIHDPGRLKEILIKNAEILFSDSKGKLKYYIKAVKVEDEWVIIDTALHSKIAFEIFQFLPEFKSTKLIKKEVPIGNSRIDFVLDGVPLEVKGVTLVRDNLALFPDAPTIRGTRHVREIIKYNGVILFLVFRRANQFSPNWEMDSEFSKTLSEARAKDIKIFVERVEFDGTTIYYRGRIPLADF
jgi:sugar fermentation stimulation protein A